MKTDYILICAQNTGKFNKDFDIITLLIPYDKLPEEYKNNFLKIKESKQTLYDLENIIIINKQFKTVNDDTYIIIDEKDVQLYNLCKNFFLLNEVFTKVKRTKNKYEWTESIYQNLSHGTNYIEIYKQLINLKKYDGKYINIVDSILILEHFNNKLILPEREEDKKNYNEYYLFCFQCPNFKTRSILLPYEILPEKRRQQWIELKNECKTFKKDNLNLNILFMNNIQLENEYVELNHRLSKIINELKSITEYKHDAGNVNDYNWIKNTHFDLCTGFDNLIEYINLLNKYPEITDSILILSDNIDNIISYIIESDIEYNESKYIYTYHNEN